MLVGTGEAATLLVCIDDTDVIDSEAGTGKQSRRLSTLLAAEFPALERIGCVRQQLLLDDRVPYTTHNSSATMVFEPGSGGERADAETDSDAVPERDAVVAVAADFLREHAADGSDPGLCVGRADGVPPAVNEFGRRATEEVVTEEEAYRLADEAGLFLDEYGGTGEGVIGALAGVGLTASGETGRFIDYADVRSLEGVVPVSAVREQGVTVGTTDGTPVEEGTLDTRDWVRPELRDGRAVLPVVEEGGHWVAENALDR